MANQNALDEANEAASLAASARSQLAGWGISEDDARGVGLMNLASAVTHLSLAVAHLAAKQG